MKKISILGSTGSIGTQTLDVVATFPEKFNIIGLAGGNNLELLAKQINLFKPEIVSIKDKNSIAYLKKLLSEPYPDIYSGIDGLIKIAENKENDLVMIALVGYIGLIPTIKAIEADKDVALANKETLVIGGELITKLNKKSRLLPVDSEHNAIFQCIGNASEKDISKIILTASGGPFMQTPIKEFPHITPERALAHPTWNMGAKVTIDSATLMNKGFEVIEAKWLFNIDVSRIDVLIHPQSIIHSLVEFKDRSVIAQMSVPDMRLPIQYALSYPERIDGSRFKKLKLYEIGKLEFGLPDKDKFPCLELAYKAINTGGTMPAVLNAANEVAVSGFLRKELPFHKISTLIAKVMNEHICEEVSNLDNILKTTEWGFSRAIELIREI